MISLPSAIFAIAILLYSWHYYRCFAANLRAAKQSGIPYVILPVYPFNRFWLVTHRLWLPLLEKLPKSWTASWIDFLEPESSWHLAFEPFKNIGSDAFLTVAPGHNTLHVADPGAITQICARRNDFPKPIEMYLSVDIFGKNVVSTEGSVWRQHRKITSPPFTEKNNHLVWAESLHQGQAMLDSWLAGAKESSRTIHTVAQDSMRLSLYVISRAGFGIRLLWPHDEREGQKAADMGIEFSKDHTMTYKDAMETLLHNILWLFLLPRWLLGEYFHRVGAAEGLLMLMAVAVRSPLRVHKIAYQAYTEWGKYMNEMFEAKKAKVLAGEATEGLDLMGAMVTGAGIVPANGAQNGHAEKQPVPPKPSLTDDEILGNAFVFILAGHETAANTIHFSLLYLALNWASQERVHKDIDAIFGDRPIERWDYDHDVPKLFGSMVGAVMNEELRLIAPVLNIPKTTLKGQPQPLTLNGQRVTVPESCYISLNTCATHRNPKYWPAGPKGPRYPPGNDDWEQFKPERWLLDPIRAEVQAATDHAVDSEIEDVGGPQGRDTSASLFRPAKGAYIPFSEGWRSCLGRRFAQVEVLAVLAVILRKYSVELAVDDFASDEEVDAMPAGGPERKAVWQKAADRAGHLLKFGMGTMITIQMRAGHVPLRVVRRGKERFAFT